MRELLSRAESRSNDASRLATTVARSHSGGFNLKIEI